MGVQDLQSFIEAQCQDACKSVDLLKIARKRHQRGQTRLRLVVDAEGCLHRLYGGYYPDWVCGGEWNRMREFLSSLVNACHAANLELIVFFNGALEGHRRHEWGQQQAQRKRNINDVLRHIQHKATPPPKVWWVAPACLRTCLRLTLRQMGVSIACSMDDHVQEVIAYCRENSLLGLVAQNSDYAVFDPPRYFSSNNLKLTYKSSLETIEYVMDEVAKILDLHPKRFCLLAALLGTHILTDEELLPFFNHLPGTNLKVQSAEMSHVQKVIGFVRSLPSEDDLDGIAKQVFSPFGGNIDDKVARFKQSVQYYLNGTKDGFLKYKPKVPASLGSASRRRERVSCSGEPETGEEGDKGEDKEGDSSMESAKDAQTDSELGPDDDTESKHSDIGSTEDHFEAGEVYTDGTSGYLNDAESVPARQTTTTVADRLSRSPGGATVNTLSRLNDDLDEKFDESVTASDGVTGDGEKTGTQDTPAAPDLPGPGAAYTADMPVPWTLTQQAETPVIKVAPVKCDVKHKTQSHEIMRIASERHQKGLLSPWIYQLLSQREIKLEVALEDWSRELPPSSQLFRPLRQKVYGLLFDISQTRKSTSKGVQRGEVCEWQWGYELLACTAERVLATPLTWPAPSLHRLWLGRDPGDRQLRLHAFLSCLSSDSAPLLLDTSYVPQHLLVLCCVLRYMLLYQKQRIIRRLELDVFLAVAVSPLLQNTKSTHDLKLPMLSVRAVHLAALFMQGVEHAVLANDVAGCPVPAQLCSPSHYFDGKLFHLKLLKVNNNASLLELCGGQMDSVHRVERLRQATLQGLQADATFAQPILPLMEDSYADHGYLNAGPPLSMWPAGMRARQPGLLGPGRAAAGFPPAMFNTGGFPPRSGMGEQHMMNGRGVGRGGFMGADYITGSGRGLQGPPSAVDTRGGQLQIAGVVVGNWGGNVPGADGPRGRGTHVAPPPHVTSVGPARGSSRGHRGGQVSNYWRQDDVYHRKQAGFVPTRQIPADAFYGVRGARQVRRGRGRGEGGVGRVDLQKVTLEQRTKTNTGGRGRGCTVESRAEDSGVMSVSDLMKQVTLTPRPDDADVFVDASVDVALSPGVMPPGVAAENGVTQCVDAP